MLNPTRKAAVAAHKQHFPRLAKHRRHGTEIGQEYGKIVNALSGAGTPDEDLDTWAQRLIDVCARLEELEKK